MPEDKKTQSFAGLGCDELNFNYLRRRIIANPRPPRPINATVADFSLLEVGKPAKPGSMPSSREASWSAVALYR
jgi:hypothetical protein